MARWRLATLALIACHPAPVAPPSTRPANLVAPPVVARALPATDRDGDGISDAADHCPDQPEDYDVFQDDDGCPDPDDDGDGIADADDTCPYTPGTSKTGCPPGCIIVTDSDDCWEPGNVWFDGGVASSDLVPQVVATLRTHPTVLGVTVTGYRARSDAPSASRKRADLIAERLVREGIAPDLLAIEDGGIDDQNAAPGFARRVKVYVTKQRHHDGRFSSDDCTLIGPIYTPAKPAYHCP